MNRQKTARELLSTAETGVRSLVAEAIKVGDYDDVLTLTNLAKAISNLNDAPRQPTENVGTVTQKPNHVKKPERVLQPSQSQRQRNGTPKPRRTKKPTRSYPRFIQVNGDLVKVGWSKSAAKEYEHKAPREVLGVVADALKVQRLDNGELRPPQEFLPLSNADGGQIPDYQSYLCLAWLRDIGVVERQGRHGYSVPDIAEIDAKIADAWDQLSNS